MLIQIDLYHKVHRTVVLQVYHPPELLFLAGCMSTHLSLCSAAETEHLGLGYLENKDISSSPGACKVQGKRADVW